MERLTAQDLSMVWPDDVGWPQDIGALAILDGSKLFGPDGRFRIEAVRTAVEARLHLVPRFRQLLYLPRGGLGWPLWVDAPSFEVSDHVRLASVPVPGDEKQLLLTVERLRRRPLDRSRPLWEMWLLDGLPAGRVGFYLKVHHAIADGAAGVATLGVLLDAVADPPAAQPRAWTPMPVPSHAELFRDNLRRRAHELGRMISAMGQPRATARQVRAAWPAIKETMADSRAPRTSFNQPIGQDRRFALVRSNLEIVRRIGHLHGGTVNDVLMAILAGGVHDLLLGRGENVKDLVLQAYVPVSLHRQQPGRAVGNLNGMMAVPLPVGVVEPGPRLRLIAAETAARKRRERPPAGMLLRTRFVQRAFLHFMPRQRLTNVYIANVPGPPTPEYLAGAPLQELFPVVPLIGNVTLGVGALSYAGQFNITVVADSAAVSDVDVVAAGMRDALHSLGTAALHAGV